MFLGIPTHPTDPPAPGLRVSHYLRDIEISSPEGSVHVPGHHARFSRWLHDCPVCAMSLSDDETQAPRSLPVVGGSARKRCMSSRDSTHSDVRDPKARDAEGVKLGGPEPLLLCSVGRRRARRPDAARVGRGDRRRTHRDAPGEHGRVLGCRLWLGRGHLAARSGGLCSSRTRPLTKHDRAGTGGG